MISINYWAVVVSAVASMVIGFLWYGPIFGKLWIRLMAFTPEAMEAAKAKGMTKEYLLTMLGSIAMSCVLAHSLIFAGSYLNIAGLSAAFHVAFWSWLGFIAPVTLSNVLWEGKSWKLWILGNSHYFVSLLVMSSILALWV